MKSYLATLHLEERNSQFALRFVDTVHESITLQGRIYWENSLPMWIGKTSCCWFASFLQTDETRGLSDCRQPHILFFLISLCLYVSFVCFKFRNGGTSSVLTDVCCYRVFHKPQLCHCLCQGIPYTQDFFFYFRSVAYSEISRTPFSL